MKAIGVDIGTAFIGSARYQKDNIAAKYVRDGFFVMPYLDQRKHMLQESKVPFIVKDRPNCPGKQDIYVIGNEAFDMAVLFGQELRRPLASGVISAKERDTEFILKEIIRRVAGQGEQGDIAYYSVPADPVDQDFNTIYHREMFKRFLTDLGYVASPINEAMAVAWGELEDKDLTGIAISWGAGMANCAMSYRGLEVFSFAVARCLAADTLVITDCGFIPIKDIDPKIHKVVDSHGNLCTITNKINNGYRSDMYEVVVQGLSCPRKMTSDHKVLVKTTINWEWKEANALKQHDIVGEPIIQCKTPIKQLYFGCETRATRDYCCIKPMASRNLGRFLGMFLGDGCATYSVATGQYHVCLAFNKKDTEDIKKYRTLLAEVFPEGINIREQSHGTTSQVTSIKITNKVIAKKMLEFYDKDGNKYLPLSLDVIPNNMALGILEGLLDSDGYLSKNNEEISLTTTSNHIMWVFRQLLGRFGISGSLQIRPPRKSGHLNSRGVPIIGKKIVYDYKIGTKHDVVKLLAMFTSYEGHPVIGTTRMLETTVLAVHPISDTCEVYDLTIDSPYTSFALPYMTVHNCGDWVDKQVAQSLGIAISDATAEKEALDLDLLDPKNDVQEAITIFHKSMLEYSIGHLSQAMERHRRDIKVKEPLNFVVAGGTSMPKGFLRLLADALKEHPLPLPVGKVWQAKNPVLAVCRGCLKAASKMVQDRSYDGVKDVSNGNNQKHAYPAAKKEEPPKEEKPKMSPAAVQRDQQQKAAVVNNAGGGFAEAIDLSIPA